MGDDIRADYLAEIAAHLDEVDLARTALDDAMANARGAETVDYDALGKAMYQFGSTARYFLTMHSPRRTPSPSLSHEPGTVALGRVRKPGEFQQGGIV